MYTKPSTLLSSLTNPSSYLPSEETLKKGLALTGIVLSILAITTAACAWTTLSYFPDYAFPPQDWLNFCDIVGGIACGSTVAALFLPMLVCGPHIFMWIKDKASNEPKKFEAILSVAPGAEHKIKAESAACKNATLMVALSIMTVAAGLLLFGLLQNSGEMAHIRAHQSGYARIDEALSNMTLTGGCLLVGGLGLGVLAIFSATIVKKVRLMLNQKTLDAAEAAEIADKAGKL